MRVRHFIPISHIRGSKHYVEATTFIFLLICELAFMGNCLNASNKNNVRESMPIDTVFKLPSPLPAWPAGANNFASGVIDIGGLELKLVSSFNKIADTNGGEPDNLGATFFEPSPLPDGFSMLGSYAQPNNRPLFGWILVAKENSNDEPGEILKPPIDYSLHQLNVTNAYFWLPIPPEGFRALGYVVTATQDKPDLDKIRCVRSDYTDELERDEVIWAQGVFSGSIVYGTRPRTRGANAQAVSVNSFVVTRNTSGDDQEEDMNSTLPISCLKNNNHLITLSNNVAPDCDSDQGRALFYQYLPYIYFHSDEDYLPSSVNWFFSNGALLYRIDGEVNRSEPIQVDGLNLPQGGSNDGQYWLDLPVDEQEQDRVKAGDLSTVESYIHVKRVLGATFTDIQVWIFYPFNGHATAKLGIIKRISLGKIGEHVGDWEHVTLRISNLDGVLYKVYFAQHSGGAWVDASSLEFAENSNKFVVYSSLDGHASYHQEGSFLRGNGSDDFGVRDDTEKSDKVMDCGERFVLLGTGKTAVEPPWLNYARLWGPKRSYQLGDEIQKIRKLLFGKLKDLLDKLVSSFPDEVFGQEGPTGPKMKSSWYGDEN